MKAARIVAPLKDFEIVELPIPQAGKGQVRIKVLACGVCHGDMVAKSGGMGVQLPRTPGHEVAGVVDEVGEGVTRFKKGDNVGIGWYGGPCGHCDNCADDKKCAHGKACGITFDGGYAEYMVAPADALARIPEGMSHKEACSLLCAGVTTFNSIRHQKLIAGDTVAIQGIGGLGHLAVQFCNKLGYKVVAISSGKEKEKLTKDLGAHVYIDASSTDAVAELKKMGGAKLIVCTAPHGKAIEPLIDALAPEGTLLLLAAVMEPLKINTLTMIMNKLSIVGWPGGDNRDSEDTMKFAQLTGVKAMIESFPLEKANEAFQSMMQSKVKFRAVIEMNHEK